MVVGGGGCGKGVNGGVAVGGGGTFENQQLARTSEKLHGEEFQNMCSKLLMLSECTNSGAGASTCYSVAPDIYSLITAAYIYIHTHTQKCQLTGTNRT